MSPGFTDTVVSNVVEDIGTKIHLKNSAVSLSEVDYGVTRGVALQTTDAASKNVKSPHQFLAGFHRLRWIHSAKHFFPAFTIHCCEFAYELIALSPFCVFARANAESEQRGHDPDGDVSGGYEKHTKRKQRSPIVTKFKRYAEARAPRPLFLAPTPKRLSRKCPPDARDTAGEATALPRHAS